LEEVSQLAVEVLAATAVLVAAVFVDERTRL